MVLTRDAYEKLVAHYRGKDVVRDISMDLVPLWCDDYHFMNPKAELVQVDVDSSGTSFTYLFDIDLQRNIVAFGCRHSRYTGATRAAWQVIHYLTGQSSIVGI